MGGDHKCPVCQATFTRPQHVARHMRSHTGDRPYKCQYCGDQFARSDLLARHINKCHANEKPLPTNAPGGRRKGSAAASRATTSKQACDQCVQSSLPCDGSNPCSKCVSRKCRCTYVKFHRQTAPSGPGHNPPRSPSSSSSSLSGNIESSQFTPSQLGGFVLGPPPSAQPVSSAPFVGPDQIFNTSFLVNHGAQPYPVNWPPADISQIPLSTPTDVDVAAKYRAQSEFLRRAGPPILSNGPPNVVQNVFVTQQNQTPTSNWCAGWGEPGSYPSLDDTKSFDGITRTDSLASSEAASFAPGIYNPGLIGSAYRSRRTSLDFSDSSSATSHSVPSSATSSSMHLPLPESEVYGGEEEMQRHTNGVHGILPPQRRASMPTPHLPSFPPLSDPSQPLHTHHPQREGSFSSAFGLMSIDDQNALAGLSSDGVPFFSNIGMGILPHSPNATPMPTRVQSHPHQGRERQMSLGTLPTPGLTKDNAEARDLKDMWKTYLRSPLSGSGTAMLESSSHPQSPSGQRRRARVSSLPSVTPTVEKGHPLMTNGHGDGGGGMRSTMVAAHGHPDDLRSYEAAVNARSASLKLNLVPKRRGTRPSLSASPSGEEVARGSSGAPFAVAGLEQYGDQGGISRPSSSSSTSSLAQALTGVTHHPAHHMHSHAPSSLSGIVKPPPMQGASISLPVAPSIYVSGLHSTSYPHLAAGFGSSTSLTFEPGSRASSVASDGTGTGGSGSDGEPFRPSFKRYASQTLGPASSKRALVERGNGESTLKNVPGEKRVKGGEGEARDAGGVLPERDGSKGFEDVRGVGGRVGVRSGSGSPGSRPMAALPERAKRV